MPVEPFRPLAMLAWGMLLVLLDFRINWLDLLPDPLGWVLVLAAAAKLARRLGSGSAAHTGFVIAAAIAAVALLPAMPEWAGIQSPVIEAAALVAAPGVTFAVCTALMTVLPNRRDAANFVRWATLGLGALLLLTTAGIAMLPTLLLPAVLTMLTLLAIELWFVVLLFRASHDPAAPVAKPAL